MCAASANEKPIAIYVLAGDDPNQAFEPSLNNLRELAQRNPSLHIIQPEASKSLEESLQEIRELPARIILLAHGDKESAFAWHSFRSQTPSRPVESPPPRRH